MKNIIGVWFGGSYRSPKEQENKAFIASLQKLVDDGIIEFRPGTGTKITFRYVKQLKQRVAGSLVPVDITSIEEALRPLGDGERRTFTIIVRGISIVATHRWWAASGTICGHDKWKDPLSILALDMGENEMPDELLSVIEKFSWRELHWYE